MHSCTCVRVRSYMSGRSRLCALDHGNTSSICTTILQHTMPIVENHKQLHGVCLCVRACGSVHVCACMCRPTYVRTCVHVYVSACACVRAGVCVRDPPRRRGQYLYNYSTTHGTFVSFRIMNNYIVWRLIDTYSRQLSTEYKFAKLKFSQSQYGSTEFHSTWKYCLTYTQFHFTAELALQLLRAHLGTANHTQVRTAHVHIRPCLYVVDSMQPVCFQKRHKPCLIGISYVRHLKLEQK